MAAQKCSHYNSAFFLPIIPRPKNTDQSLHYLCSLYKLFYGGFVMVKELETISLFLTCKDPSEIQTHSLLFVPAPILPPLGHGMGGVGHRHSHSHQNNLHSHCHHYTQVSSLCTCLQSKIKERAVCNAQFSLTLKSLWVL